ncbi:MAG: hypothetical protein GXY40_09535 [Syntrophomonadaceae bacterium]|nr:hypothetical protein [Syntrophomonadaceae bacterium]
MIINGISNVIPILEEDYFSDDIVTRFVNFVRITFGQATLELKKYEELVHHYADMRIPLDLDDGVKVNYAKLDELLAKI